MSTARRRQAAVAAGLMVGAVLAAPGTAAARLDPGTTFQGSSTQTQTPPPTSCPLRRVGDQLVVCDDLTGGVTAPAWVPELTAS